MSEKRRWQEAFWRESRRTEWRSCLLWLKWCRTMEWAGWLPGAHGE